MSDPTLIPPASPWIIRPDELRLQADTQIVGRQLVRGQWRDSLVIVKVLAEEVEPTELHSRGELWTSLQHDNVLQMFGASPVDADPLYVVIQCQRNGSVTEFLRRNMQADRAKIVYDVALGMQYLHGHGVVHGGLKPPNILIKDDGTACISDYAMVEVQSSGSDGYRYFSPEAWKGTVSRSSDVFAWAMSALQIFTSKVPWGILTEKQIFAFVVQEHARPDRPDEDFGLTDRIWALMEKCWQRESRQRPTFDAVVDLLQSEDGAGPACVEVTNPAYRTGSRDTILSRVVSTRTVPPAYEFFSSHPDSAPPTMSQFTMSPTRVSTPGFSPAPPHRRPQYAHAYGGSSTDAASIASSYRSADEESRGLGFHQSASTQSLDGRRPAPISSSSRSSRSATSSATGSSSRSTPNRFRTIDEEPSLESLSLRSLPAIPATIQHGYYKPPVESIYGRAGSGPFEYAASIAVTSRTGSAESLFSQPSTVNTIMTNTAPNATLLVGALQSEVKEGRQQDIIDPLLSRIQRLGRRSHKDAQKLVTAGAIPALISLLKTRAVDGTGLETVLIALGILSHDPISANTIFRTNTTATLIGIVDAAQSQDITVLALWCLARICRNADIANGLLKQHLSRLLVTKGLRANQWRTSRMAAWCIGALVHSDSIADIMADFGVVPILCEHMRRCVNSTDAGPDDQSAAIYAIARMSRSIKIAKALAKGGCVEMLARCLNTAEDPQLLLWSARAVGCLMRPNSSDMAKMLLDAGIPAGLARLPSMLPTEQVEPLGAFAFAIQRFSCAEWGGGTRKALVEAGVVDSLLAGLRTAADEPYPQVHIELAYAIALLSDVGGSSIRKEIVNAGGINILKQISASATTEVAKVCNLAATSINGNVWSRNTASAKAALAHEWNGGCPDYAPECPASMLCI
ncbi:hypothetical protein C8F04DRAFT_1393846 [Mycena alexandri]|uniref:Protein kinase domain-containing protein n=1 Tax=Mycena alexandri TaxID=1745969 RepID=A0AAD6T4D4_9AGAR|nr:hypothetical protein C8F04DRAFT_1393846 [Mycena alexandri]